MAELRQSLFALVDNPPAAPPPVEQLAARGARFVQRRRMRRIGVAALAVLMFGSLVGVEIASQRSGDRGLEVASDGRTTAGYIAEAPGGYVGTGAWTITITRAGQAIELSSTTSDYCGPLGVILPGDEVRGSITGAESTLRVGETATCPK